MFSFPDWLFQLTSRDEQSQRIELINGFVSSALDDVTLFLTSREHVLVLTNFSARLIPSALETTLLRRLYMVSQLGGNAVSIRQDEADLAAAVVSDQNWSGHVIMPPAWRLAYSTQTGGTPGASIWELSFSGILLPRGNIVP